MTQTLYAHINKRKKEKEKYKPLKREIEENIRR
jgi:hypothetical protein